MPEMKMLERALREVLALRDALGLDVTLDEDTSDVALAKLDRQSHAHWPAADDQYLCVMFR
jgi:hypothetical protein